MMNTKTKMACLAPFYEAAECLGVHGDVDDKALKRAYRVAVNAHPPDLDPEGFRRVRAAYELLSNPDERLDTILRHPTPWTLVPSLHPMAPISDSELAQTLLKHWAGSINLDDLVADLDNG